MHPPLECIGHTHYFHHEGGFLPRELAVLDLKTDTLRLLTLNLHEFLFNSQDYHMNTWCIENVHGLGPYPRRQEVALTPQEVTKNVNSLLKGRPVWVKGSDQVRAFQNIGIWAMDLMTYDPGMPTLKDLEASTEVPPPPTHAYIHMEGYQHKCSQTMVHYLAQHVINSRWDRSLVSLEPPPNLEMYFRGTKYVYVPILSRGEGLHLDELVARPQLNMKIV